MEPLKEMFGKAYYQNLARAISSVHKPFPAAPFLKEVTTGLEPLSLNERMRHTSRVLQKYLPEKYTTAVGIMKEVVPLLNAGYTTLVFPDFVSQFGTKDLRTSLDALKYFTQFGSSEFAIRTFFKQDQEKTLRAMYTWSEDDNVHVRRLASEGSRPRLPWSFKLDAVINNPALTAPILENLKADDELYVRKSVANHLNDITKDSPDYVMNLIQSWDKTHTHTAWIIKRGCRSLLKQGHEKSMAVFGLTADVRVKLSKLKLDSTTIQLNDNLQFAFEITSEKTKAQKLMIDYRIHYVKKTGVQLPKVFKLKEIELAPGETIHISKKQRFQDFTTRTLHAGTHVLEVMVNGKVVLSKKFELVR
ncbi:DNA alkylation repair protein [Fulvivirgaceae bacterium PWU5]|uniref:DNA alkylation repair protein n=1 Tax=Dawidia cretensis TaxID=2782350 RepID=A0AAP2DT54_9BACT|nr:DNA alkylation repair protein [Dawidia cretensis]MBT1707045.1 DNA alkylation repair protein [Dawidia cretensis]